MHDTATHLLSGPWSDKSWGCRFKGVTEVSKVSKVRLTLTLPGFGPGPGSSGCLLAAVADCRHGMLSTI